MKKAALEKEQEEKFRQEQKLLKQQEREQRRLFNEARRFERENQENQSHTNTSYKQDTSGLENKCGKNKSGN
jgi:hypothetical protein